MRIAMVSEHASPLAATGGVDAGGQNVHVAALAGALSARGHRVTVFTRRDDPHLPDRVTAPGGYVVEHVTAGPARHIPKDDLLPLMPGFARHLERRLTEDPHDVLHAHFWMSGIASVMAREVLGIPVVQTFHALGVVKRRHQGDMDSSPVDRVQHEAELCTGVDYVIATSVDEVFELRRMGMHSDRVAVVPCGVDLSAFSPDGPAAVRGSRRRIVVVSRLVQRKGIDDCIRALAHVDDAELVIAGGPEHEDLPGDPEAARLRAVALEAGVADRVLMLGAISRAAVPVLMRSADVVVATPWYEPFGMVALEAMACGVPVVASAVGGLADTVADGVTGMHVPPHDPGAIARAVNVLLGCPEVARQLGASGAARARQRYSWDAVARQTLQAYQRARSSRPTVPVRLVAR